MLDHFGSNCRYLLLRERTSFSEFVWSQLENVVVKRIVFAHILMVSVEIKATNREHYLSGISLGWTQVYRPFICFESRQKYMQAAGAVLALARWGAKGATIPAGGAGGHNMQLN